MLTCLGELELNGTLGGLEVPSPNNASYARSSDGEPLKKLVRAEQWRLFD